MFVPRKLRQPQCTEDLLRGPASGIHIYGDMYTRCISEELSGVLQNKGGCQMDGRLLHRKKEYCD